MTIVQFRMLCGVYGKLLVTQKELLPFLGGYTTIQRVVVLLYVNQCQWWHPAPQTYTHPHTYTTHTHVHKATMDQRFNLWIMNAVVVWLCQKRNSLKYSPLKYSWKLNFNYKQPRKWNPMQANRWICQVA